MSSRAARTAAALALALAAAGTRAAAQERLIQLDHDSQLILVRRALSALDQANQTGNYTVLRDLGAPAMQANTAARLGEIFAPQRQGGLDLSLALVMEPQINSPQRIDADGVLHITGFFASTPRRINFEVAYQAVGGVWKLYGLAVSASAPEASPGMPKPPAIPADQRP
jgi:hypothetical protein